MSFNYERFRDQVLLCCAQVDPLECPECGGYGKIIFDCDPYTGELFDTSVYDTCTHCEGYGCIVNEDISKDWHREWLVVGVVNE